MAIDYNWSRVESKEQSGKVISWVVGLSATEVDGDKTYGAYIDMEVLVAEDDQKELDAYTQEEVLAIAESTKNDNNWDDVLTNQINAQKEAPVSKAFILE